MSTHAVTFLTRSERVDKNHRLRDNIWFEPGEMIDDFYDYIAWLDANKLEEEKLFGGEGECATLHRMRMPTIQGFQFYLRITRNSLLNYIDKGKDWFEAMQFIEDAMAALCIEGAAAGLLKEMIVMRKLGLADKQEVSNTTKRVVILHTPDNGRSIEIKDQEPQRLLD